MIHIETSLDDITITEDMRSLANGENFLWFDSDDKENRFMIFCTIESLNLLKTCNTVSVDGTFKACPVVFEQLWCIHGWINNTQIPLVFSFLPKKDSHTYKKVIRKIMEHDKDIFKVNLIHSIN